MAKIFFKRFRSSGKKSIIEIKNNYSGFLEDFMEKKTSGKC